MGLVVMMIVIMELDVMCLSSRDSYRSGQVSRKMKIRGGYIFTPACT
jgi:hypothetical protein